jgi:CBS-domain-containing membrane protein
MKCVGDVMTYRVITVDDRTPFKDVVRLIRKHGVSALPVLDQTGRLVGVVSEADLMLKEEHAAGERSSRPLPWRGDAGRPNGVPPWIQRGKAQGVVARELMTSPVVTVAPGDAVALAARIMRENRVKRLPVTDAEGDLVGIVSRSDLLTTFLRSDDEIRAAIEDELTEPRPSIEEGQIRVVVEDGVAKLGGHVGFKSQIPRIVSIARAIDGVVDVESRLEYEIDDVGPEGPSPHPWARSGAAVGETWRSPEA